MMRAAVCMFSCMLLTGCGASRSADVSEFILQNSDSLQSIKTDNAERVDSSEDAAGELAADFSDLENVDAYSRAAVLGKVVGDKYNYVADGGLPWTFNTVVVEKVLKGDLNPGDIIAVGQQTGYMSLRDYYNTVDEESKRIFDEYNPGYTEGELNTTYIWDDDGCPDLADGYKLILALSPRELSGLDGSFWEITAGNYGQFFEVGNDKYMRIFDSMELDISPYQEKVRENPELPGVYTFEELQSVFQYDD